MSCYHVEITILPQHASKWIQPETSIKSMLTKKSWIFEERLSSDKSYSVDLIQSSNLKMHCKNIFSLICLIFQLGLLSDLNISCHFVTMKENQYKKQSNIFIFWGEKRNKNHTTLPLGFNNICTLIIISLFIYFF